MGDLICFLCSLVEFCCLSKKRHRAPFDLMNNEREWILHS